MKLEILREAAFKSLFQIEFNKHMDVVSDVYEMLAEEYDEENFSKRKSGNLRKIEEKVEGTRRNLTEIDAIIEKNLSEDWKFSRLALTDRNILRLAVYEMIFAEKKLTPAIAINEAINLAKKYGSSDDSGKFVNGVLNSISEGQKENFSEDEESAAN